MVTSDTQRRINLKLEKFQESNAHLPKVGTARLIGKKHKNTYKYKNTNSEIGEIFELKFEFKGIKGHIDLSRSLGYWFHLSPKVG